ncbi:hypothetical protein CBL_07294 [Carabus blaptoides fortunei]
MAAIPSSLQASAARRDNNFEEINREDRKLNFEFRENVPITLARRDAIPHQLDRQALACYSVSTVLSSSQRMYNITDGRLPTSNMHACILCALNNYDTNYHYSYYYG